MNTWRALGLLCLIYLANGMTMTATSQGEQPDCETGEHSQACTRDYMPVCGTDGTTYSNECMLCFYMREESKMDLLIKSRTACP